MALVLAAVPLGAQTKESKTAPVEVKRVSPPKPLSKEPVPTPDKYPFGELIQTLGPDPTVGGVETANGVPNTPASIGSASASDVPSDFRLSKDVALPVDCAIGPGGGERMDGGEANARARCRWPGALHVWRRHAHGCLRSDARLCRRTRSW